MRDIPQHLKATYWKQDAETRTRLDALAEPDFLRVLKAYRDTPQGRGGAARVVTTGYKPGSAKYPYAKLKWNH